MKKLSALILVLALCLAGCGAEAPETTAAPTETAATEAPTTVPTTEPVTVPTEAPTTEPTYPAARELAVGETTLTLELFDGGGYVIYVPQGQWRLESTTENGNLTDCWTGIVHKGITVKVVSYGETTPEAVEKQILVLKGNYHFDPEESGHYHGIDNVRGRQIKFNTCTDGTNSYALMVEYPGGVRFDPGLEAMLDSFELK